MMEWSAPSQSFPMSDPGPGSERHGPAGQVHLSSRQLLQFAASVKSGNLYELKQFFAQLAPRAQGRAEAQHIALQQLAAGLVHLLSEGGHEQMPLFDQCLQLLAPSALTQPIPLRLEQTYEAARQAAAVLGGSHRGQTLGATLLDAIFGHVGLNYADERLSLATTAKALGFSAGYLGDYFKRTAGRNFTDYLISVRLEKAKTLLRATGAKAYEVAFACGFSNPHYFSVVFKKHVGITPSQFREQPPTDDKGP